MTTVIGIIFILKGIVTIANPKMAFDVRAWIARNLMGMKVTASKKTLQNYKLLGVFLLIVGLLMLVAA